MYTGMVVGWLVGWLVGIKDNDGGCLAIVWTYL